MNYESPDLSASSNNSDGANQPRPTTRTKSPTSQGTRGPEHCADGESTDGQWRNQSPAISTDDETPRTPERRPCSFARGFQFVSPTAAGLHHHHMCDSGESDQAEEWDDAYNQAGCTTPTVTTTTTPRPTPRPTTTRSLINEIGTPRSLQRKEERKIKRQKQRQEDNIRIRKIWEQHRQSLQSGCDRMHGLGEDQRCYHSDDQVACAVPNFRCKTCGNGVPVYMCQ